MALSEEVIENTEFAKDEVMNSDLDQKLKKQLYHLLEVSAAATNGISTEEKIQKITESIHGLVLLQLSFINAVDKKIEQSNSEKCQSCKAMKYVVEKENQSAHAQMIKKWAEENGFDPEQLEDDDDDKKDKDEISWQTVIKNILMSPGIWVLGIVMTISPYGVDIVKAILEFCSK